MINKSILNKVVIVLMFLLAATTLLLTYQYIIDMNNNSKSLINDIEKLEQQEKLQLEIITNLQSKERFQVEVWADAIEKLFKPEISDEQKAVLIEIIEKTGDDIQAIVLNENGDFSTSSSNFKNSQIFQLDKDYLDSVIFIMKSQNDPIKIDIPIVQRDSQNNFILDSNGEVKIIQAINYIYYKDSEILDAIDKMFYESKMLSNSIKQINLRYNNSSNKLKYLPIVIFIISLFLFLSAYYIFYYSQKSTQNKLWVGMAKETAHQIGTPLSSLIGWADYFKEKGIDSKIINEIEKDTDRLKQIANRFSKIGSRPSLEKVELKPVLQKTIDYIKKRASKKIQFKLNVDEKINLIKVNVCVELFSWVTENILKNSIDSIQTDGVINVYVKTNKSQLIIDFCDNGKGILKSNFKNIFEPGYTSKKRGWGLGLSLSKRIISEYHSGQIFVFKSVPYKETVLRIILNK
ncbi:MAG: hypothetical protein CBC73_03150 [Flavobacteriales bacterium TMED113]|nr:MAG: hypothetical protein CBC73_03150 [Flavobacteriales bacterium TMED113]